MARFALCEIDYEAETKEKLFENDSRWSLGSLIEVEGESAEEIWSSAPLGTRFFARQNNVSSSIVTVGDSEPIEVERWYSYDFMVYPREYIISHFDKADIQFAMAKTSDTLIAWKESLERSQTFLKDDRPDKASAQSILTPAVPHGTGETMEKETPHLKPATTKKRSKKDEKEKAQRLLKQKIIKLHEKMRKPKTKRELTDAVNDDLGTTVGERTLFNKENRKFYEDWKKDYSNRTVKKKRKSPTS